MRIRIGSLEEVRTLAEVIAGHLGAGDLLILTGNLGAGKTTFTQALGRGLDVEGRITSPTFVIAREHPSTSGGPTLVHVDAYRLGAADELSDLDLDSELEESITVVEWGEGLAEQLSTDYLSLTILHGGAEAAAGRTGDGAGDHDDVRGDTDINDSSDPAEFADFDETDPADDDYLIDEERTVDLVGHGPGWGDRLGELAAAIEERGFTVDEASNPASKPAPDVEEDA